MRSWASLPLCSGCAATSSSATAALRASSRATPWRRSSCSIPEAARSSPPGSSGRRARCPPSPPGMGASSSARRRRRSRHRSSRSTLLPAARRRCAACSTSTSIPRAIEFPTGDEAIAHAFYYPPTNAEWEGLEDERPPLRVICHGGPTDHSSPQLELKTQFFTQRGIGVVDVNYRGSTGYGRDYRRLLNGRWGEIDWQDCVAAARDLAERG